MDHRTLNIIFKSRNLPWSMPATPLRCCTDHISLPTSSRCYIIRKKTILAITFPSDAACLCLPFGCVSQNMKRRPICMMRWSPLLL